MRYYWDALIEEKLRGDETARTACVVKCYEKIFEALLLISNLVTSFLPSSFLQKEYLKNRNLKLHNKQTNMSTTVKHI